MPCCDGEHKKVPSQHVGLHADRSCTNCIFILIFLMFCGGMGYVSFLAFSMGDIDRLIYGVDYLGNICGKTEDPCKNVTNCHMEGIPFPQRKYLWYPVTYSVKKSTFLLTEALQLGVCVDECPQPSGGVLDPTRVPTYGYLGSNDPFDPQGYSVLYKSSPKYNRCFPDFFSFECGDDETCNNTRSDSSSRFDALSGVTNALNSGFKEVKTAWWIILVSALICIIICFVWLFCLRRMVKPIVVITIFLAFVALGIVSIFLWSRYRYFADYEPSSNTGKYYMWGAIGVWVVMFFFLCLIIFIGKDIMVACDIIEEASKVPISLPAMVLVPPVTLAFLIPFFIYALFVLAHIYTASSTSVVQTSFPTFSTSTSAASNTTEHDVYIKEYTIENWRDYGVLYTLFMFLWTMGFMHAIAFMICAFCAVFWYWSVPGDNKKPEGGVCTALALTFKNHIGTLLLGSMIIAIMQIIRVILGLMEKHLDKAAKHATLIRCVVNCAQCCMAYLERFVKFINKNAYIMTAMTGQSFLGSARHALSLLGGNVLSVGAVTIIGEYVMIFGKLFITAASCASAYGILRTQEDQQDGATSGWIIIVAVGLISYFIACVFLAVFGVCIDTVLLSYCYDLDCNNGMERPYYFPDDLAKHLSRSEVRKEAEYQKQQQLSTQDIGAPLDPNGQG